MGQSYLDSETRSLSSDIIRTCWWVIALYIAFTGVNSFVTSYEQWPFLRDVTVLPGIRMVVLWICLELYVRKIKRYLEFVLLFCTNLLVSNMVLALYELPISIYLLIFPILISLFYFRKDLILFALTLGLATLMVLYSVSANLRSMLSASDVLMVVAMLVSTALIINKLRKHASAGPA